jgi:1,4-dihydroxy-2-naphthoyl-CoA hydrolase
VPDGTASIPGHHGLPDEPLRGLLGQAAHHPGGDLAQSMGLELTSATAERVAGRMPVKGNTQPYGLLHGGASCVLAETLGSVGAVLHAGPGRIAVGVDINATHHRSLTDGYVSGVATRVHGGRTLATYDVVITDELDRRVCTARITCMLRDAPQ